MYCTDRSFSRRSASVRILFARCILNELFYQFLDICCFTEFGKSLSDFVQQLKHIGILAAEKRSHSGKISEYDAQAKPWMLREEP